MIGGASFEAKEMQDLRYDFACITQPLEGDLGHSFRRAALNFFQEHKLGFGWARRSTGNRPHDPQGTGEDAGNASSNLLPILLLA